MEATRLNLGAGSIPLDGYRNRDGKNGDCIYPLPDADASVDEIRASHVLEHFSHRDIIGVLADWVRVLRPGGLLRIAVPDLGKWVTYYQEGANLPLQGYLMGGQVDEWDYHKANMDGKSLTALMEEAGLENIGPWQSEVPDCASLPISLNLQGWKKYPEVGSGCLDSAVGSGGGAPVWQGKVAAVMSMPRLAFTGNMFSALQTFPALGIPCKTHTGVFWDQALERLLSEAVEFTDPRFDYVVTTDYDSVFDANDLTTLLNLMVANPDVAAVFPVQARRSLNMILVGIKGEDGKYLKSMPVKDFQKPLLDADYGHFGLTVIRTSVLRQLPHPWFFAKPNNKGLWEEGKHDADISFWKLLMTYGHRFCLAPQVRIGHCQQVITWPMGENCTPGHQYFDDLMEHGRPV